MLRTLFDGRSRRYRSTSVTAGKADDEEQRAAPCRLPARSAFRRRPNHPSRFRARAVAERAHVPRAARTERSAFAAGAALDARIGKVPAIRGSTQNGFAGGGGGA